MSLGDPAIYRSGDLPRVHPDPFERRLAAMTTITKPEAKTHFSRYLAEVEQGREYIRARTSWRW